MERDKICGCYLPLRAKGARTFESLATRVAYVLHGVDGGNLVHGCALTGLVDAVVPLEQPVSVTPLISRVV